ncbi:DUF1648 domain-containing protein [Microbacterium esteraromaticum]|uniref:DUF1648 domain-containing protein n=1 Tax=Microbacterium esteraromaticum TaxID=57043 RepID=A0A7D8AM49_9MICO|nr:DUF1648 domain-containing protein [Microbacterium esteraromaticum]QMU97588.1 DUF1648 domain-containing protein [Microbacterium esteraromaticum]
MTSPAHGPTTQPDTAAEVRRARRALIVVGLVAPAVLTAAAVALIALWMPELPDPVAMHWGSDGVDGFAPPAAYLWLAAVLGLGLPLLLVTTTLSMARTQWGVTARFLGAIALGLSGFSAVIAAGSVWMQRGLADAAAATNVLPVMIGGFCALLVLSAVGWVLQPDVAATPAATLKSTQLRSIAAGERVVWMGTATMARPGVVVIGLAAVMLIGVTGVMLLQAPDKVWIPLLVLVVVGLALAATASFRVRVGVDGLTVRSQLGAPRLHVPLDEISSVRAIECHPFAEFGGVGWRVALDGRTGIVLRSGPAIEVSRRGKGAVVVTVDGAETAAATLQAHLEHRSATR